MLLPLATRLGKQSVVQTPLPIRSRPQGFVLHISDVHHGRGVHSPPPFRRLGHLDERPFADPAGADWASPPTAAP